MEGVAVEATPDQPGSKLDVRTDDKSGMDTMENTGEKAEDNSLGENAEAAELRMSEEKTISRETEEITITEEVKDVVASDGSKETLVSEEVKETIVIKEVKETIVFGEVQETEVFEEAMESVVVEEAEETEVFEEAEETEVFEEAMESVVAEETQDTENFEEPLESVVVEEVQEILVSAEVIETVVSEETPGKGFIEEQLKEKVSEDEAVKDVREEGVCVAEVQECVSAAESEKEEMKEKVSGVWAEDQRMDDGNNGKEIEKMKDVDEKMGTLESSEARTESLENHFAELSEKGASVEEKPLETFPTMSAEENQERKNDEVDENMGLPGVVEMKNESVVQEQSGDRETADVKPPETLPTIKVEENNEEKDEVNDRMDTDEGVESSNVSIQNHVAKESADVEPSRTSRGIEAVETSEARDEKVDEEISAVRSSDLKVECVPIHVVEQSVEGVAAELKPSEADEIEGAENFQVKDEAGETTDPEKASEVIDGSVAHHNAGQPGAAEADTTDTAKDDLVKVEEVLEKMDTEEVLETKDGSFVTPGVERSGLLGDAAEVEPLETSQRIGITAGGLLKDEQALDQMDIEEGSKTNNESFSNDGAEKLRGEASADVRLGEIPLRVEEQEHAQGVDEVDDAMDTDEGLESGNGGVPNHVAGQSIALVVEPWNKGAIEATEYGAEKDEVEDHMETECSEIQHQSITTNHFAEHSGGGEAHKKMKEPPSEVPSLIKEAEDDGERKVDEMDVKAVTDDLLEKKSESDINHVTEQSGERAGAEAELLKTGVEGDGERKIGEVEEKAGTKDHADSSLAEEAGDGGAGEVLLETSQTMGTGKNDEGNHDQVDQRMDLVDGAETENISHVSQLSVEGAVAYAELSETRKPIEVEETVEREIKEVEKIAALAEHSEGEQKDVDECICTDAKKSSEGVINESEKKQEGDEKMGTEGAETEILSISADFTGESDARGTAAIDSLKADEQLESKAEADIEVVDTTRTCQADAELSTQTVEAEVEVELDQLNLTPKVEDQAEVELDRSNLTPKVEDQVDVELVTTPTVEPEANVEQTVESAALRAEVVVEASETTPIEAEAHVEPLKTTTDINILEAQELQIAHTVDIEAQVEPLEIARTIDAQAEPSETSHSIEVEGKGERKTQEIDENTGTEEIAEPKILVVGNASEKQSGQGGAGKVEQSESREVEMEAQVEPLEAEVVVEARVELLNTSHKIEEVAQAEPVENPHKIVAEAPVEPEKTSETSEIANTSDRKEEGHEEMDIDEDSRPERESVANHVGENPGAAEAETLENPQRIDVEEGGEGKHNIYEKMETEDGSDTKIDDDSSHLVEQSRDGGTAEVGTPQGVEAEDNCEKHTATDRSSEEKSTGGEDDAQDETSTPPPKRRKGKDGRNVKTPVKAPKGSNKPCGNPEQVELLKNVNTLEDMQKLVAERGRSEEGYKVGDVIEVDDLTQTGYQYSLEAPVGKNFAEGFNPAFTPKEMLVFGVFEGDIINDCIFEFPKEWYMEAIEKGKISVDGPDDSKNQFKVNSRMSSKESSRKRGWSPKEDPRGWFQWYCRYYLGRRLEPDDTHQMSRWRQIRRHAGQIKKSCAAGDLSCRVKQRQTLLNWSHDCFM